MNRLFNKSLHIIGILILGLLMVSCFAPPEAPPEEEYSVPPPAETIEEYDRTITLGLVTDDYVMESWPIMTQLYALSSIKANYKTIRPSDWQDTVTRILSSGSGYDFVELNSSNASHYKDTLVDITPYLEEYAPDYLAWANTIPSFASDYAYGQPITYFPFREDINTFASCAFADPAIRDTTIMDIDEFTTFMEGKHLSFRGSVRELTGLFAPYFGTSIYWYNIDGQMVYGPTSEEFKLMLKVLNNFYNLGIIPEDFEYNPPSSFILSAANTAAGVVLASEDDFEWLHNEGYKPVMLNFSSHAYIPSYPSGPSKMGGIIAGTGNEIAVLQFINTCFSDEGRALLNYGVDGVHTLAHHDGSIEYLQPYTNSGVYQWRKQGLTPEGLPGIYYNSWAAYEKKLQDMLIPLRQYLPKSDFLVPINQIQYTSYLPKQMVQDAVENTEFEWWNAFIKGEKSLDWDWGDYLSAMNSAGCYQGYLESSFN